VDAETKVGRCDFEYSLTIDEPPSLELRQWLREDLFVRLHTSSPVVKIQANEEDGSVKEEVVMGEDGQPVVENSIIGVSTKPMYNLLYLVDAH
jgi:hypothetical protein